MGLDIELFVFPERISPQLICPICTQVLENPVQTSSEHLFCEDELLEWMTRSTLCPVTKSELDPNSIRKPGRIIMNMLAELEMYCSNKSNGCMWTGQNEHLQKHLLTCQFKSCEILCQEISQKEFVIQSLNERIDALECRNEELNTENIELKAQLKEYENKIRIYDAFLLQSDSGKVKLNAVSGSPSKLQQILNINIPAHSVPTPGTINNNNSDVDRMSRLRTLQSLSVNDMTECKQQQHEVYSDDEEREHRRGSEKKSSYK